MIYQQSNEEGNLRRFNTLFYKPAACSKIV